ncbi:hypothetical protein ApAK_08650 [Thermoplasmatales archaeon AK]|nr:hypothetical protein [Thermoplasmatales archaeon AK]
MTEFRTKGKGKDRIVYPLKRRQPYGVPREVAYEEVMALRRGGKRARLIETNQRLDLYAPYESVLPEAVPEDKKFSSYEEIERAFGISASDAQAWADAHPDQLTGKLKEEVERLNRQSTGKDEGRRSPEKVSNLRSLIGIDSSTGKLNLNSEDLSRFFSERSKIRIFSEDGRLTLLSLEPDHVAMIQETMETSLPNGYFEPEAYGRDFSVKLTRTPPAGSEKVRFPTTDYSNDAWTVRLEGDQLRTFLKALQKSREDTIRFRLEGDSQSAGVGIFNQIPDPESSKPKLELIESVPAVSNRPKLEDKPTGWDTSERSIYPVDYLRSTIRTMLGRKEFLNPETAVLSLKIKPDYPIEIHTRKLGPNGEHIEVKGIVAPRMEV